MKINAVEYTKDVINSNIIRIYNFVKLCIKYPIYKKILVENSKFKDQHKNKRCFILGNGPSLEKVDFSKINNEFIFTVNQLHKNSRYRELYTNYHIWTDPIFFDLSNNERISKEYVEEFYDVNTLDNKPVCFVPMQAKKYIEYFKINKEININYIHTCLTFFDGINSSCNFAKLVPSFSTVIINAIQLAIYMGFKEIYLLGCDCTGINSIIDKVLGKKVNSYAYSLSDRDKMLIDTDFEKAFDSWSRIFHQYKWIENVCKSKNIKLINCTKDSILNVLTYVPLEKILREENYNAIAEMV